jgi:hypothetical protein
MLLRVPRNQLTSTTAHVSTNPICSMLTMSMMAPHPCLVRRMSNAPCEARDSVRTTPTLSALVIATISIVLGGAAMAQDCSWEKPCKTCNSCSCKKRTKCCCHFESPPLAPILGSAPALMAPIVITPASTTALPNSQLAIPRQSIDRDALRDFLAALDNLNPSAAPSSCRQSSTNRASAPNAASAPDSAKAANTVPQPIADETVDMRLNRMDEQLSKLEQNLKRIDEEAAKAITKLDARLNVLEGKN